MNFDRHEVFEPFAPLDAEHPLVRDETKCPGCGKPFLVADVVTLVTIGPGEDPQERAKAKRGGFYNAVSLPAHWACVTGDESD